MWDVSLIMWAELFFAVGGRDLLREAENSWPGTLRLQGLQEHSGKDPKKKASGGLWWQPGTWLGQGWKSPTAERRWMLVMDPWPCSFLWKDAQRGGKQSGKGVEKR